MKKCAFMVIDMQNDFIKYDKSPVFIPDSIKIVENINNAIRIFRENNSDIFFVLTEHSENSEEWGRKDRDLGRRYCIQNTQGALMIDEIKKKNEDIVITKKFYSAFFETNLLEILKQKQITDIFFGGVTTGCCVSSTARDAYNYDFSLFFIEDCLTATSKEAHNTELIFFKKSLGAVIGAANVEKLIRSK